MPFFVKSKWTRVLFFDNAWAIALAP
jgi:hypothetical protein